jgi:hypothetical protein
MRERGVPSTTFSILLSCLQKLAEASMSNVGAGNLWALNDIQGYVAQARSGRS